MSASFFVHAGSFVIVSTVALSVGQAWAVAGTPRRPRYMLVWAAVFVLMLWLGMRVLGLQPGDPIVRAGPVGRSLVTISGLVATVSLGAGSAWGRYRRVETAAFSRRVLILAPAHIAAVLIGGALAYVLISIIWISQIH